MKHTNLDYLKEISNGSKEFMAEMLGLFLKQTPETISILESSLREKDWVALRNIAHKMKPSIAFMGLKEIEQEVKLLEEYAGSGTHLEEIPALVAKVKSVCVSGMEELKDELKYFG